MSDLAGYCRKEKLNVANGEFKAGTRDGDDDPVSKHPETLKKRSKQEGRGKLATLSTLLRNP